MIDSQQVFRFWLEADKIIGRLQRVIGGSGAFIIVANGFQDYARAVRQKLILEIANLYPNKPVRAGGYPVQLNARPSCFAGENRRQDCDDDY